MSRPFDQSVTVFQEWRIVDGMRIHLPEKENVLKPKMCYWEYQSIPNISGTRPGVWLAQNIVTIQTGSEQQLLIKCVNSHRIWYKFNRLYWKNHYLSLMNQQKQVHGQLSLHIVLLQLSCNHRNPWQLYYSHSTYDNSE